MKRLLLLLAVLVLLIVLAWLAYDWWHPALERLSDELQGAEAILSMVVILGGGVAAFLGLRGKAPAAEPIARAGWDFPPELPRDPAYEPTPVLDTAPALDEDASPYLGLSAFQKTDDHLFFGRHRETREALAWLGAPISDGSGDGRYRWLQIEGNSGAGKSSLVNAGLLPLIERGALASRTGLSRWRIIGPMMPGEQPLRRLAEVVEQALVADPEKRDSLACQQRLEGDERALAYWINDHKAPDTAFLLVIDQFEELFTFSEREERRHLDRQLAYALQNGDCPLYLINTVRIDYLEGFEQLPGLSELYNSRCRRYLLKTISREGLREAIERPAEWAGLDVSEVTTALLRDASDEIGALPLVENALQYLWEQRRGKRLSGALYEQKGGIAGLLEKQADALLERLDKAVPGGKGDALELLLALTRTSDQGNHTRQRLSLEEARKAAGGRKADEKRGQTIIDHLSGRPGPAATANPHAVAGVRLVSVTRESAEADTGAGGPPAPNNGSYVDLIHETLIRMRGRDPATGKRFGYWRTLYDYIEKNRDRGFYREQLTRQAHEWQASRGLGRWRRLAGWGDLLRYRRIHPPKGELRYRFKRASLWAAGIQAALLAALLSFVGQAYWWTLEHCMPPGYMLTLQKFRLMRLGLSEEPLPELVEIPVPNGEIRIGELDEKFGKKAKQSLTEKGFWNSQNFGYPSRLAAIGQAFAIGRYELTYEQYDYYVWASEGTKGAPDYPSGAPGNNGRGHRPVTNVSWNDANTYLAWLREKTGEHYRLPTEAEWEYAARAGTTSAYWWGNEIGQGHANCDGCGSRWDNKLVAPVGSFAANPWDLYDTAGNVWEWTCSEWQTELSGKAAACVDPGETSGTRAIRGGSWDGSGWLRSSARYRNYTVIRGGNLGFRVLRAARTN